jgi:hypothetical protein
MSEENELDEAEQARAEQAMYDSDTLEATLPTSMTHQEMVERNTAFWKQGGEHE